MHLKTSTLNDSGHSDTATCVDWINSETIFSCGDDHKLLVWNITNKTNNILSELPNSLYPLDMHCLHRSGNPGIGKQIEAVLITSTDGKFHLLSNSGRIEKSVDAHLGAVFVGRWNFNSSGFLTAGEDGQIKLWSKSGMLRSTFVTIDVPIYSAAWSFDSQSIVYTIGRVLCIKSLAPNTKPIKWNAHDELILKVAWSSINNLIISGGEDCRYKVWDSIGRPIFSSQIHDYPISSLSWSPDGQLFCVGGYNTLRLCDFSGWSHSLEKPNFGSLYQIAWSNDGTQIASATATGNILFAHIIDRHLDWKNYLVNVIGRKSIVVNDLENETNETLDFPERVIQVSFGYDHLVVATTLHCYIYNINNWNTPVIFDLKEGAVCMILLSEKNILIVEKSSIGIYNYQGRLISSPRWAGLNPERLNQNCIAISIDTLVSRDQNDHKLIHLFDLSSTRTSGIGAESNSVQFHHSLAIIELALSQCGLSSDRHLAIIDNNRDIYLIQCRTFGPKQFKKLGNQILSMKWNLYANMLAVIQDAKLLVWYCPTVTAATDQKLMRLASLEKDTNEFGSNSIIQSFQNNLVRVRRSDGSLLSVFISPFALTLQKYVMQNRWQNSLSLCRTVKDDTLWACLVILAVCHKNLEIAEEAFSSIGYYDKVNYIHYIKDSSSKSQQVASSALLSGSILEAESLLLHNGMVLEAIEMNMNLYKWERALDLAIKHKSHLDMVKQKREEYLLHLNKEEKNKKFLDAKLSS